MLQCNMSKILVLAKPLISLGLCPGCIIQYRWKLDRLVGGRRSSIVIPAPTGGPAFSHNIILVSSIPKREHTGRHGLLDKAEVRANLATVKPDCPVARRGDYSFGEIEHAQGLEFIREHHYAGNASKTGKMFGMVRPLPDGRLQLVGVAQWLPPTKVCAQSVQPARWKRVISLTRVVVSPGEPQNATGMLVSQALRWIKERGWISAVTFADDSQGHTGIIYRATNWKYKGETRAAPRWVDAEGRQVSTKAGAVTRRTQQMRDLGYRCVGNFKKHKFVLHF